MRKEDRAVEIVLHGQQWKCLQAIAKDLWHTSITIEDLRKYVEDKPQKLRSYLAGLVTEGYLDGETFLLTEKGKAVYKKQMFWKQELIWWMRKLRVPEELVEKQADILLDTMEPEVIQRIHIQNEYLRTLERNRSCQETFHNSDLSGKLPKGIYKAKIAFLDPETLQGESGYTGFSSLNQSFSGQATVIVEPLKSRLMLHWKNKGDKLKEVCYQWEGEERHRVPEEDQLAVPVADLNFVCVRTYGILEGRIDMAMKITDKQGTERTQTARLMVSLPINERR